MQQAIIPGGTLKATIETSVAIGAAAGLIVLECPAGKKLRLYSLVCDYVASATVGNRTVYVKVCRADGEPVWITTLSANIAASATANIDVAFGATNATPSTSVRRNLGNTANTTVGLRENCPIMHIPAGYYVRIDDAADIAVTDALTYRLVYDEFTA